MIIMLSMVDVHVQRVLAAESRAALLDALAAAEHPLSVDEAAHMLGLHPSTTRFHLDLLVSAGLVERSAEKRSSAGRPRIRYSAREAQPPQHSRPVARPGDEDGYRRLASVLANELAGLDDPAQAAREAGRRWSAADEMAPPQTSVPDAGPGDATTRGGAATVGPPPSADAAVRAVAALMDRLGFAPELPVEADRILLHRCPFEAVAREQRAVVCGVHAGLLEETFARLGGEAAMDALEPFASDEPLLCIVRLRRARSRDSSAD